MCGARRIERARSTKLRYNFNNRKAKGRGGRRLEADGGRDGGGLYALQRVLALPHLQQLLLLLLVLRGIVSSRSIHVDELMDFFKSLCIRPFTSTTSTIAQTPFIARSTSPSPSTLSMLTMSIRFSRFNSDLCVELDRFVFGSGGDVLWSALFSWLERQPASAREESLPEPLTSPLAVERYFVRVRCPIDQRT